jgi:glutaredoxin
MNKATFYHAGCPVCVSAEQDLVSLIDRSGIETEIVHLGEHQDRIHEAEEAGVTSVPALVLNNHVFHINFGASLKDVKS